MATQLDTNQIKDGAITQPKLADNALRPVDGGDLSDYELTFGPEYRKKYALSVDSNINLSIADTGNTADSWIIITATGNGSNTLFFQSDWKVTGTYDPNLVQRIELYYDGTYVFVTIVALSDVIVADLTAAENIGSTPTLINLTFSSAVAISTAGWTLTSDDSTINVVSVDQSGISNPVFTVDRSIVPGETLTISYNPTVGSTTSLSGTELTAIGNFAVDVPPAVPPTPPGPSYDITVGPSGKDYTTISAASAAAVAGESIGIYAGTYRETVTGKTGVTYEAAEAGVIVSGLELIGTSGWTAHDLTGGKAIYKKTITLPITGFSTSLTSNTSIVANQIFKDGDMQIQARYPKIVDKDDLFDQSKWRHQSNGTNLVTGTQGTGFQPTSITDTALGSLGNLTGGTVFISGWFISGTRTISSHSSNTINFPAHFNNEAINVNFRKWWFVTNKLQLLTAAKEWHYEGGILYYWQTGGGTPSGTLEYKARNWGFDLSDKTDIVIKGITFIGCEIRGNAGTHRCTVDNIRASYTNHVFAVEGNWERHNMEQTGFRFIGSDNTVTNSEFDWGASNCIWLGNNGKAINNKITNYCYEGNYGAGVAFWGNTSGQLVERNSIYDMGRSCVDLSMTWDGFNTNWQIRLNDFYAFAKLTGDVGAIYTARRTNTTGAVVSYNWIHDSAQLPDPQGLRLEGICASIYWDQGTGPATFHHNVLWNNWTAMPTVQDAADFYILSRYGTRNNTTSSFLYNNTFESAVGGSKFTYVTYITVPQDIQKNNIYNGGIIVNWGGNATTGTPAGGSTTVTNSILSNQTPVYIATGTSGLYYRPASGSALQVDAGVVIAGITDGYVGSAPDCGAYEWGGEEWVPGYNQVTSNIYDATTTNVTYSSNWLFKQNVGYSQAGWYGGTISYSDVSGSTATFTHTGTRFRVYAERLPQHGTGTITLDGGAPQAVDFNDLPHGFQQLIWDSGTISSGSHTIVLTPTSGMVLLDYIEVTP